MDFDDYDKLGDGYQENEFDLDSENSGDDWLAQHDTGNITGQTVGSERTGLSEALMVGRTSHLSISGQRVIKSILEGQFDASKHGSTQLEMMAAVEEFTSVTGVHPRYTAEQIRIPAGAFVSPVKILDATGLENYKPSNNPPKLSITGVIENPKPSDADVRLAIGALQSSGEYMDIGPGGRLISQSLNERRTDKKTDALVEAFGGIGDISGMYFTDAAKAGPLYPQRKQQLEGELANWILDQDRSWSSDSFLPLPNQLNTDGLIPTASAGWFGGLYGGQKQNTSPYTPLEHGHEAGRLSASGGDMTIAEQESFIKSGPSLANTFAPMNWDATNPQGAQKFALNQLEGKVQGIRQTLRGFSLSTRDEYRGNTTRILGLDNIHADQAKQFELRHESSTFLDMGGLDTYGGKDDTAGSLMSNTITSMDVSGNTVLTSKISSLNVSSGISSLVAGEGLERLTTSGVQTKFSMADKIKYAAYGVFDEEVATSIAIQKVENNSVAGGTLKGTGRGGMYGENYESEASAYIREGMSEDGQTSPAILSKTGQFSDMDLYDLDVVNRQAPAQGSPEWLKQREGMVTGSKAKELWKGMGDKRLAITLAKERMGISDTEGNAYTARGNAKEDKVKRAFLAKEGLGLTWREAFFETNDDMPGFGASPDGRLYDSEGASKGLLELKYFGDKTFPTALKDTMPQMQMQMMVTGESQTHFYAMNADTGEYDHRLVPADKKMQDELYSLGNSARAQSRKLNAGGIIEMQEQVKGARRKLGAVPDTGQTSAVDLSVEADTPMTAVNFSGEDVAVIGAALSSGDARQVAEARQLLKSMDDSIPQSAGGGGGRKDGKTVVSAANKESNEVTQARQEEIESVKASSQALRDFQSALGKSVSVLGELGGLVTGGNESGMSEVRLAGEAGLDVGEVRGMREALVRGNLSESGATSTIRRLGQLTNTFSDEGKAPAAWVELLAARGRSTNSEAVRGMIMPSYGDWRSQNTQQKGSSISKMIGSVESPRDKAFVANMFGVPNMAAFQEVDGVDIMDVDQVINPEGLKDTMQGIQNIEQAKREVLEGAGSLGEETGEISAAAKIAAAIAGSATLGAGGYKLKKMLRGGGTNAGNFMANSKGTNATKIAKTLSIGAKTTPIALAASAASTVVRGAADIEDDGGLFDSAMDIAEFTAAGSMFGPVGAGVGLFSGVVNEVREGIMPDKRIEPVPGHFWGGNNQGAATVINNIEVNTTVDKEGITNEILQDGDSIYLDDDKSTGWTQ